MTSRTDRRAGRPAIRRLELRTARPVDLLSLDELAVLRAVCLVAVQQGADDGVWRPELRRELSMTRLELRRHLRRLVRAGVLETGGTWAARTLRSSDAGLATLSAAHDLPASARVRAND